MVYVCYGCDDGRTTAPDSPRSQVRPQGSAVQKVRGEVILTRGQKMFGLAKPNMGEGEDVTLTLGQKKNVRLSESIQIP